MYLKTLHRTGAIFTNHRKPVFFLMVRVISVCLLSAGVYVLSVPTRGHVRSIDEVSCICIPIINSFASYKACDRAICVCFIKTDIQRENVIQLLYKLAGCLCLLWARFDHLFPWLKA